MLYGTYIQLVYNLYIFFHIIGQVDITLAMVWDFDSLKVLIIIHILLYPIYTCRFHGNTMIPS